MARPPAPYTRLPGRGLRRVAFGLSATRCRLWLGRDHLLAVDSTVATERYRRFYFREIEALIVRRTAARQIWNWVFALLGLLSAGPFFLAWRSQGTAGLAIAAIVFGAVFALAILVNSLRGAICETHARTAAQLERLPTLGRLPRARKVIARLRPLIEAAQGAATPEEVAASPWAMEARPVRQPRHFEGRVLQHFLCGALVLQGIVTGLANGFATPAWHTLSIIAVLAAGVLAMVSFARQSGQTVPGGVRAVTITALIYCIGLLITGFGFMIAYTVHHPGAQVITGAEMVGEPGFANAEMAASVASVLLGLAGFVVQLASTRPAPAS